MTAFPRCPECNGQRVPMNYVGDVVGAVCYCGFARRAEPSTSFEDVYRTQTAEITRLRARLEVRDDGGPDGILCRDESIRMQDAEIARLRAEVEALKAEDARQRKLWQKENDELVQILGKALRYPKFVDDQSVFPGATEADGVCVPCHTGVSIADEAAAAIETLRTKAEAFDWMRAEHDRHDPMVRCVIKRSRDRGSSEWVEFIDGENFAAIVLREASIDAERAAQGERG